MKILIVLLSFMFTATTYAQVGIGTINPASSAALDITSTSKGLLPPRMTKASRDGIATPVAGLITWCSDCGVSGELQVYNGTNWTNIIGGPPAGLAVGDSYGGGKVAYILQTGDPGYKAGEIHGLIAAPGDQSQGLGASWGCEGTNISGAGDTVIGTGTQNTIDIVNGCATAGIAARLCDDLVLGGYSDWYLPNKHELSKLHLNRFAIGGFSTIYWYWSSSEINANEAWSQRFVTAVLQYNEPKHIFNYVRAIRSF